MNIKEVFEKCTDGDFVIDNFHRKWKVDKGDLSFDWCDLNDFYTLKQILDLEFTKVYGIDWSKVEFDTKILVSNDDKRWYHAHFAMFENGIIYTFNNGATSFTHGYYGYSPFEPWQYAKLYKEDGEEEKNGN